VYVGPIRAEFDLQQMKIYRVAAAETNDPGNYLRVIDDSGEDYLYPARFFEAISLSDGLCRKLRLRPRSLRSPAHRASA
jgi:hypothetical protein